MPSPTGLFAREANYIVYHLWQEGKEYKKLIILYRWKCASSKGGCESQDSLTKEDLLSFKTNKSRTDLRHVWNASLKYYQRYSCSLSFLQKLCLFSWIIFSIYQRQPLFTSLQLFNQRVEYLPQLQISSLLGACDLIPSRITWERTLTGETQIIASSSGNCYCECQERIIFMAKETVGYT